MTIQDLALKLIKQSEVEVYSMLHILKEMKTDEARIQIRAREREYAAKKKRMAQLQCKIPPNPTSF